MFRELEALNYSFLNGIPPSNPSPQGSGNSSGDEAERWLRAGREKKKDIKELRTYRYNSTDTHMYSQRLW